MSDEIKSKINNIKNSELPNTFNLLVLELLNEISDKLTEIKGV